MVMGGQVGRVGCEGRDMTWVCSELETKGRRGGVWTGEGGRDTCMYYAGHVLWYCYCYWSLRQSIEIQKK